MKSRGFTLIELLALIIIFAIIGLILIPFVTKKSNEILYSKIVCNYNDNATEYNIDEVISLNDTTAVIKNGGKIYEFQRNNCYLIRK